MCIVPAVLAQNKYCRLTVTLFRSAVQEPRNIVCANTARQAERPAYENSSQLTKQTGAGRRVLEPARERANHGAAAVTVKHKMN